jgi:hypothetical protein
MKQVIARIYPLTNTPVIFDVDSRASGNGRLKAFMNGEDIEVGYDFYMHTEHLDPEQALKIAKAYADHVKIPPHDILVRQRFPKSGKASRKLSDANLTLVKNDEKTEDKPETLQQLAQEMHDNATNQKTEEAVKPLEQLAKDYGTKEEQKASADKPQGASAANPEGATVKRSAQEKAATNTPAKRKYEKKTNKRSEAAMKRYMEELSKTAAQSETLLQPAVAGPGVTQAEIDDATMQLALKLAKLLKNL